MSVTTVDEKFYNYDSFFLISLDETTLQLQKSIKQLEKILKGLKDKVCDSKRITSIRIPSGEVFCFLGF